MPELNITPEVEAYAQRCANDKSSHNGEEINWLYNHVITAIANIENKADRDIMAGRIGQIPYICDIIKENHPDADIDKATTVMLAAFLLTGHVSRAFGASLLPEFDASYVYACIALKSNTRITPVLTARELEQNLLKAHPWNKDNPNPDAMLPIYEPACLSLLCIYTFILKPNQIPVKAFSPDATIESILRDLNQIRADNIHPAAKKQKAACGNN